MQDNQITDLDALGMRLAAIEEVEKRLGIRRDRRMPGTLSSLESLEDLLKRDKERENDGFFRKIRFRRVLAGSGKIINIPYVVEDKLVHGEFEPKNTEMSALIPSLDDDNDIDETTGHGDGDVGDVIGEVPMPGQGGGNGEDDPGDGPGPGAGEDPGDHGFEEEAYETGKRLMENMDLPNLKEKTKKVPTDEYTYDLTDRRKGSGQLLDKKATLTNMVKTNLILGRVTIDDLDTTKMIVAPQDRVYRVLSKEILWKAQAVVIFIRDYSGSMWGDPTKALVAQHLMIYAWLLVQYEKRVLPRFFVHDTIAREVSAREYFGLMSGGGTTIASGYKKINEVVEGESLETDYNIYVFQGTDGDDSDWNGAQTIPELQKILKYVNRMGVTLFKHAHFEDRKTTFEQYVEASGILSQKDVFRMHTMSPQDVTEEQNVEALKILIAQD